MTIHRSSSYLTSPYLSQNDLYQRPNHKLTSQSKPTDPRPARPRHSSLQRHLPPHNQHGQSPQSPLRQRQKRHNPRRRSPTPPLPLPAPSLNHNPQKQIAREPLLRHPSLDEPIPRMGRPRSLNPQNKDFSCVAAGFVPPFQLRVPFLRSFGDYQGVGEGQGGGGRGFWEWVLDVHAQTHERREEELGSGARGQRAERLADSVGGGYG